jgi:hypothetical protein
MKGVILAVALLPEGADPVNSTLRHPAMAHFHLRTLPGYTWPPLADMALSQVWVAYQELDRIQWLPSAEIEQQQLEQVRVLLSHAIAYVPYYRELLPKAGITPGSIQSMADFRRIPLLPRRTYQEKNASFAATRLPAGTVTQQSRPSLVARVFLARSVMVRHRSDGHSGCYPLDRKERQGPRATDARRFTTLLAS